MTTAHHDTNGCHVWCALIIAHQLFSQHILCQDPHTKHHLNICWETWEQNQHPGVSVGGATLHQVTKKTRKGIFIIAEFLFKNFSKQQRTGSDPSEPR